MRIAVSRAIFSQSFVNMGRRSRPAVHSQTNPPIKSPRVLPVRMSPAHTAKLRYSHAQPAASRNTPSASTVCRGRRGRRNP